MEFMEDVMEGKEKELLDTARKLEGKQDVESLKDKYKADGGKVYDVTVTVQVDDDTEEEFSFLFRKPKPASYDRYVKTISNSVTKASKSFVYDNMMPLVRGRELKQGRDPDKSKSSKDAPCAGARIETQKILEKVVDAMDAPCAGARIETLFSLCS